MDRLLPALAIVALIAAVVALMALGWRARRRRQSHLAPPLLVPDALGPATLTVEGFYVATTPAEEPLERIVAHGLGFRARAAISVHAEGLVIDARGRTPVFVPTTELRGAGSATWAIDRVVEKDGLVVLGWMLGSTAVDSYVRLTDRSKAAALIAAVIDLVSASEPREGIAS